MQKQHDGVKPFVLIDNYMVLDVGAVLVIMLIFIFALVLAIQATASGDSLETFRHIDLKSDFLDLSNLGAIGAH